MTYIWMIEWTVSIASNCGNNKIKHCGWWWFVNITNSPKLWTSFHALGLINSLATARFRRYNDGYSWPSNIHIYIYIYGCKVNSWKLKRRIRREKYRRHLIRDVSSHWPYQKFWPKKFLSYIYCQIFMPINILTSLLSFFFSNHCKPHNWLIQNTHKFCNYLIFSVCIYIHIHKWPYISADP